MAYEPDLYTNRSDDPLVRAAGDTGRDPSQVETTSTAFVPAGLEGEQSVSALRLARVVNMAIRVGRGAETMRNLARELEPYGVVRRES